MKQQMLLSKFDYAIPGTQKSFAIVKDNHRVTDHLPLMNVKIDFEKSMLKIEGDWNFMMAKNIHNETSWFKCHLDRVEIETTIYPCMQINLHDPNCDGLILMLEGKLKEGNRICSCSGLLVFDKGKSSGTITNHWSISFYLYDFSFGDSEIKFKLPVYISAINSELN